MRTLRRSKYRRVRYLLLCDCARQGCDWRLQGHDVCNPDDCVAIPDVRLARKHGERHLHQLPHPEQFQLLLEQLHQTDRLHQQRVVLAQHQPLGQRTSNFRLPGRSRCLRPDQPDLRSTLQQRHHSGEPAHNLHADHYGQQRARCVERRRPYQDS